MPRAGPEFLFHHRERESLMVYLDLAPMGVGIQPIISHRDKDSDVLIVMGDEKMLEKMAAS
jgi:hypothetical protein